MFYIIQLTIVESLHGVRILYPLCVGLIEVPVPVQSVASAQMAAREDILLIKVSEVVSEGKDLFLCV